MRLILIIFSTILLHAGMVAQDVKVTKLPLNTRASQMAPLLIDSVLYYSSNQSVNFLKRYFDENRNALYHMFSSELKADSTFSKPQQFQKGYLSPFNTASIAFSPDGQKMYVGQNHYDTYKRSQKSRSGNLMGVYEANMGSRGWSRKSNLPFNSRRDYNTAHPTISDDGRFLFFVSDMENGYGKTDIYFSENINGEWGPAENLGANINSAEVEVFPFYHSSGKLIFASNGHGGQGGLDLFYTIKTASGWTNPVAFDETVNTEANEFSCYISDDEQWGIFASDRSGNDNLYRFDRTFPTFEACNLQEEDSFCYEFFDDETEDDAQKGPYIYRWTFGDTEIAEGDTVIHCFPGVGEYKVKLSMVDTSIDQEVFALSEYSIAVERMEQVYISCPDTVKVNELIKLDASKSNTGDFAVRDYYWELEDGTLQKGETIQHIFRTKGKYLVKCGAVSSRHPQLKMCSVKEIIVSD